MGKEFDYYEYQGLAEASNNKKKFNNSDLNKFSAFIDNLDSLIKEYDLSGIIRGGYEEKKVGTLGFRKPKLFLSRKYQDLYLQFLNTISNKISKIETQNSNSFDQDLKDFYSRLKSKILSLETSIKKDNLEIIRDKMKNIFKLLTNPNFMNYLK